MDAGTRAATARTRAAFIAASAVYPMATDGGAALEAAAHEYHADLHSYDEGASMRMSDDSGLTELCRITADQTAEREKLLEQLADYGCTA